MGLMKEVFIGIDEAGKGSVLGSLFISSVLTANRDTLKEFKLQGVRDSKMISPSKRSSLAGLIYDDCLVLTRELDSKEIDETNLNDLVYDNFIGIINDLMLAYENESPDEDVIFRVYVDCPIKDTDKYAEKMDIDLISRHDIDIICENKADDKYTIVGAASIIAKTSRDRHVQVLNSKYIDYSDDIGCGYPADNKTVDFLKDFYGRKGDFPTEARRKWYTLDRIREEYVESSNR
jgi:ribonuclease HII